MATFDSDAGHDEFPDPPATLDAAARDDAWDNMVCPRCTTPAMWAWITPGGRSEGCQCNECGHRMTLRDWHKAQGGTAPGALALALAAATGAPPPEA